MRKLLRKTFAPPRARLFGAQNTTKKTFAAPRACARSVGKTLRKTLRRRVRTCSVWLYFLGRATGYFTKSSTLCEASVHVFYFGKLKHQQRTIRDTSNTDLSKTPDNSVFIYFTSINVLQNFVFLTYNLKTPLIYCWCVF